MATSNTLHFGGVTGEREIYNGEADMVGARGTEGVLGILTRHAALLTTLAIGEMRIKLGDAEEPLFVAGGFLEVRNNVVTVLADTAEHAEEIDEARAEEARRRAQERLEQATSDVERADMLGALERAMSRIKVAELAPRRGGPRTAVPRPEQ